MNCKLYEQQRPSTHNYDYDEVGNLIKDKSEDIEEIKWTVTGKVSDVTRTAGSQKPDLHFDYDAMGQRIAKTVTNKNVTTGDKFVTTYYVRDPQGNVLAVYEHKHGDSGNGTFTLTEQHLYGASRLGMKKRDLALNVANASESTTPVTHYELTNHLGNVMAVISDKASTTAEPTVVSLTDYYPFGMTESGRTYRPDYRYGFNGKEKENKSGSHVDFGDRIFDLKISKWLCLDPVKDPSVSPYVFCSNSPIIFFDPNGRVQCNPNGSVSVDWTYSSVVNLVQSRQINNGFRNNQLPPALQTAYTISNAPGCLVDPTPIPGGGAGHAYANGFIQYGVAMTTNGNNGNGVPFLVSRIVDQTGTPLTGFNAPNLMPEQCNCFGFALLGGQYGIPNGYEAEIVLNNDYIRQEKNSFQNGNVIIYKYPYAGNGCDGLQWDGNPDISKAKHVMASQHAAILVDNRYPYAIDGKNGYQNGTVSTNCNNVQQTDKDRYDISNTLMRASLINFRQSNMNNLYFDYEMYRPDMNATVPTRIMPFPSTQQTQQRTQPQN